MENAPLGGKEKLTYILAGALLFNLMPIIAVFPLWPQLLHASLLYIYSWPAVLAEDLFGFTGSPFPITVLFWAIVGGMIGYLLLVRLKRTGRYNAV